MGTIVEKKAIEHKMCVLIFLTTFVWNISRSKKNWARYAQKCLFSSRKIPVIIVRFIKIERSRQIFKKYSNIKFHIQPFSVSRVVSCEWTDGRTGKHDESNSCFSQFCERA